MALKYKIIENKKTVYVIGAGVITYAELMHHLDELARDHHYKSPMKKLVDYRNIASIDLSMTQSELFAQKKAELNTVFSGEKCAIVAPLDISFGMARVHDTLIGFREPNIDTMVFRDLNKALNWLDVELDPDELIIG